MNKAYKLPLLLSVGIHLAVAAFMLMGDFTPSMKPKPTPVAAPSQPIKAVVVSKQSIEKQANKIKKRKAEEKAAEQRRLAEIERKAAEARKKRQKEQERIKNLEKQRKKKEREKRVAEENARKAKAKSLKAEKERKRKEAERKKAEKAAAKERARKKREAEEKRKKKEAERKRKEAERKRKAQEAKERAAQEAEMARQMEQEMASRQQARRAQVVTEINRYTALITATIQRHLITDKATMAGKSCKLNITLAPSGFVTNVQTGQGSAVVCNAAKNAVLKAGTLPVSKDPEVFKDMRKISLTVIPEF